MDKLFWLYYKLNGYIKSRFYRYVKHKYWQWKLKQQCESFISFTVNGPTKLNKKTVLGKNVNFNGLFIHGNGKVEIGDNFHSGQSCLFVTSFHDYEGTAIPYDSTVLDKKIVIEENVWLGNNVIILGGIRIGEGAIIQAGSVVVKDVPKCAISGGYPAKTFKYRDKEHYYNLKAEEKFH